MMVSVLVASLHARPLVLALITAGLSVWLMAAQSERRVPWRLVGAFVLSGLLLGWLIAVVVPSVLARAGRVVGVVRPDVPDGVLVTVLLVGALLGVVLLVQRRSAERC